MQSLFMSGKEKRDLAKLTKKSRFRDETGTPRRSHAVPAPSSGGGVPVRITGVHPDSPTSGVRMFIGDAYADGTEEDPTDEAVPIKIMDIVGDIEAYPDRALIATPISQEWTKAGIDTTETVYEVEKDPNTATACPAIITGGSSSAGYIVDLYGEGLAAGSTGTATLQIMEIHLNETVPTGTKVIAHAANVEVVSGWGPA